MVPPATSSADPGEISSYPLCFVSSPPRRIVMQAGNQIMCMIRQHSRARAESSDILLSPDDHLPSPSRGSQILTAAAAKGRFVDLSCMTARNEFADLHSAVCPPSERKK